MAKVVYVKPGVGGSITVDAYEGDSVMQAAVDNGIGEIVAECNGTLACATCHVYVAEDDLSRVGPPSEEEAEMLAFTAAPRTHASRLSCQLSLNADLDGLVVWLPEEQ